MFDLLMQDYSRAKRRLLLLDYDGTLVKFAPTPSEAEPTINVLELLGKLCEDPKNTVVVVSGRDRHSLEDWLGQLPLGMAAEHGWLIKDRGEDWHTLGSIDTSWKPTVRRIFESACKNLPESQIEDKESALVWHYRQSLPNVAQDTAHDLISQLKPVAAEYKLQILPGNKIIEVLPPGINKGAATRYWLDRGRFDFVLGAGDDRTDENIFAALPEDAYSIKIGAAPSDADNRLPDVTALLNLLQKMTVVSLSGDDS